MSNRQKDMGSYCRCVVPQELLQEEYRSKKIQVHDRDILRMESSIVSRVLCRTCDQPLNELALLRLGLRHLDPTRTKAFATQFYQAYENHPEAYHLFSLAEDREGIIANLIRKHLAPDMVVVDIGSGTGKFPVLLAPYCKQLFAIDPSYPLTSLARDWSAQHGVNNIIHLIGKGEQLPLPNASVDLIYSTWGSYPLTETFAEMKRVLKKDGVIIRIGAQGPDEFTSLFPKVNKKIFSENNRWFAKKGFTSKHAEIAITFNKVTDAKKALKQIIGVRDGLRQTRTIFKHKIIIQTYSHPL